MFFDLNVLKSTCCSVCVIISTYCFVDLVSFMLLTLNLSYVLKVTTFIFCTGLFGLVLNRKNILVAIMCIELLLLSVNLNFIIFSLFLDDIFGFLFVLFVLTVAAAESSLGLSILALYYRLKSSILLDPIKNNKAKI